MKNSWRKLALLVKGTSDSSWRHSHASYPVAALTSSDSSEPVAVYFSSRDPQNRSAIGRVFLDLQEDAVRLLDLEGPLLKPGERGAFDDSGVTPGTVFTQGTKTYLYYLGWSLGTTVPFRNAVGLAVSENGGRSFERVSRAPVLDRHALDPFTLSYPWVLPSSDGFTCWYGSHVSWESKGPGSHHAIRRAVSLDGLVWTRDSDYVLLPDLETGEVGLSRPCVLKNNEGSYEMWYSSKSNEYRLGYARSADGIHWSREDSSVGIQPSETGWDSKSLCYGTVFRRGSKEYLLYNGSGYGKTGFGIAVRSREGS